MAKIAYIPEWLGPHLRAAGNYNNFASLSDLDTLCTRALINYHTEQVALFRVLTGGVDFGLDFYHMYNGLFIHPLPCLPEINIMIEQSKQPSFYLNILGDDVKCLDDINVNIDIDETGSVVFIERATNTMADTCAATSPTAKNILNVMQRVNTIAQHRSDHSAVFDLNRVLTDIYTKDILS